MWAGRLGYNFKGGPSLFFFFLKINQLKKRKKNWAKGARAPTCVYPWPCKTRTKNKNKTRLITIQQYKSQTAKTPDGKLKNKDETYWDFSDEKRWRLRAKGQRKRGKSVAFIIDIEGMKIWDELGFFLGVGSCGLFSLWTKNWKLKKKKKCKCEGFELELLGKKNIYLPPCWFEQSIEMKIDLLTTNYVQITHSNIL